MKIQKNNTLRNVMAVSVACGLALSACGSSNAERQQPKVDTSGMHAPANNPQLANGQVVVPENARAPEGNASMMANDSASMGATYTVSEDKAMAQAPARPAAKKDKGLFDWAWNKEEPSPMANAERRVPVLNQNPGAAVDTGMASYEMAAPVDGVDMSANGEMAMNAAPQAMPQSNVVVGDEVIMMDDTFTPVEMDAAPQTVPASMAANDSSYPSLGSVPPRPERLNAIDTKDARMQDMQTARSESMNQQQTLNAQVHSDSDGSLMAQNAAPQGTPADVDAEFAALVAADQSAMQPQGEPVVIMQDSQETVVSSSAMPWEAPADVNQAPAPIEMASAQPQAAATAQAWEPAPLVAPQTEMTPQTAPAAPVQPVQENQWVSLQQDPAAQMAVPVEQVEVNGAPQVATVSAIPVVPEDGAAGGIQLTPPSQFATVRTLPESRYAARRQAVYMQRYGHIQASDEGY